MEVGKERILCRRYLVMYEVAVSDEEVVEEDLEDTLLLLDFGVRIDRRTKRA